LTRFPLYLDDGFGFAENNELCYEHAQVVKNDIVRSGLVPNKDKRVFGNLVNTPIWRRIVIDILLYGGELL
jgi:hypothetical protein